MREPANQNKIFNKETGTEKKINRNTKDTCLKNVLYISLKNLK